MWTHHLVWVRVPGHGEAHRADTLRQPVTLHQLLSTREQRASNCTTVLYCTVLYCTVLYCVTPPRRWRSRGWRGGMSSRGRGLARCRTASAARCRRPEHGAHGLWAFKRDARAAVSAQCALLTFWRTSQNSSLSHTESRRTRPRYSSSVFSCSPRLNTWL